MTDSITDDLLRFAAHSLTGHRRRLFQAEVTARLCDGNARRAERRFGWGRANITTGQHERQRGIRCVEKFAARGRPRVEGSGAEPSAPSAVRSVVRRGRKLSLAC